MSRSCTRCNFYCPTLSFLFLGIVLLLLPRDLHGQTTIWTEDFEDESVASTSSSSLVGNNWTAVSTLSFTGNNSGVANMAVTSDAGNSKFQYSTAGDNGDYVCVWTSEPIDITGFSVTSGSDANSASYSVTGDTGPSSWSHSVTIVDNSATISITLDVPKDKSLLIDAVTLSGTCTPTTWYADTDGDGLGDSGSTTSACSQPAGYVADSSDLCDDTSACNYDANSNTNASCQTNDACGVCGGTGVDSDSDGVCDDVDSCTDTSACNYTANPTAACSFDAVTWYEDADGDGLGDPAVSQTACSQPSGYVNNSDDDDPNLNASNYTGTVLSPGDVYFSYAAEKFGSITASYVGFVLLKDVAAGTKLVLSPSLRWDGDSWVDGSGTTAYEWTAPSDGVLAGTEVVLFDIFDPSLSSVGATGVAKCDTVDNLVRRTGDTFSIEGGVQCGTYVRLGSASDYFTWNTPASWIFQPNDNWDINAIGSAATDGNCRHLNCIGYDLEYSAVTGSNTGTGTLIAGSSWGATMDPEFSFEDNLFYLASQWSYSGGSSPVPFENVSDELQPRSLVESVSFSASNGATPTYTSTVSASTSSTDYAVAYDALDFNPNGCISLPQSIGWDALTTGPGAPIGTPGGSATLNITVDSGISLSVDVDDAVACNDIAVTTGSFAACDGLGRELSVAGDISLGATATFEGGAGTLKMAGLTLQTLDANNYSDPTSTKVQLNNLQVLKNKVTKVSGHVRMKPGGSMTFDDLAMNDELALDTENASSITFESDATSGTSAIGPCASSNFANGTSQEFTFQRYIPADTDGSTWVNIGAYVTGTTVSDWTSANSGMLIFKYDESNYGSIGAGWSYLWDGTTELTPGSGYMALVPQNQDALISVTGAFQIGDVNIALTFTDDPNQSNTAVDGWNLVSNPYPSAVDLAQVISRVDGVEAFYIYDNTGAGGYTTVNENGVGGSDTLDVGQSFWVKVSANKTLTFEETDKVTGSNTFIRELPESFEGAIGVHITNEDVHQWSKAFIQFDAESTGVFDQNEDAVFYGDPSTNKLNVWMTAESGEKLSIQSAGGAATTPSIPLHLTSGAGGTVRISGLTDASTPSDICAVVEDLETGERAQLGRDVLEVNLPANTTYTERFIVHFTPEPSMMWESTVCNGLDVTMSGEAWESWDASWSANDGSASGTGMPYELEDGEYTFEFSLPAAGCVQSVDVTVETACLGDFNLNGERDVVDLLVLLSGLPTGALESEFAIEADCDCDGSVTVNDMLTFLTVFGTNCE